MLCRLGHDALCLRSNPVESAARTEQLACPRLRRLQSPPVIRQKGAGRNSRSGCIRWGKCGSSCQGPDEMAFARGLPGVQKWVQAETSDPTALTEQIKLYAR